MMSSSTLLVSTVASEISQARAVERDKWVRNDTILQITLLSMAVLGMLTLASSPVAILVYGITVANFLTIAIVSFSIAMVAGGILGLRNHLLPQTLSSKDELAFWSKLTECPLELLIKENFNFKELIFNKIISKEHAQTLANILTKFSKIRAEKHRRMDAVTESVDLKAVHDEFAAQLSPLKDEFNLFKENLINLHFQKLELKSIGA